MYCTHNAGDGWRLTASERASSHIIVTVQEEGILIVFLSSFYTSQVWGSITHMYHTQSAVYDLFNPFFRTNYHLHDMFYSFTVNNVNDELPKWLTCFENAASFDVWNPRLQILLPGDITHSHTRTHSTPLQLYATGAYYEVLYSHVEC